MGSDDYQRKVGERRYQIGQISYSYASVDKHGIFGAGNEIAGGIVMFTDHINIASAILRSDVLNLEPSVLIHHAMPGAQR